MTMKVECRKALLALLLLVPAQSIVTVAFFWWSDTAAGKIMAVACKLWLVLLPVVWLKFVNRGQLSWSPPISARFIPRRSPPAPPKQD